MRCCDLFYVTERHHSPDCPKSSNHAYARECERRGVTMYDHLPVRAIPQSVALPPEIVARIEKLEGALREIAACHVEFVENIPAGFGPPILSAEQMAAKADEALKGEPQ